MHLENPIRQSWHEMITTLAPLIGVEKEEIIPFDQWLTQVKSFGGSELENPAQSLLDFFKNDFVHMATGEVILDTANMRSYSQTLQRVNVVSEEHIVKFIEYWKEINFLR
jgi:hypothetical protein